MNISQLLELAATIDEIKKTMLASDYQANSDLTSKTKKIDYPCFIIHEEIPSREEVDKNGFTTSYYLPSFMLLLPCKHDEDYIVKHTLQESLRSIARKLVYRANNSKEVRNTGLYIVRYNIAGKIDTQFDENLICCEVTLEIPHIDQTQSC